MDFLKDFITSFWDAIETAFSWLLDGFLYLVVTVFYWFYDGFLTLIAALISTIDLSSLGFTEFSLWLDLPLELIYMINQFGLPQCASIIAGAYSIRLILNLIPSTLTRV
jgi:hypothetical protein